MSVTYAAADKSYRVEGSTKVIYKQFVIECPQCGLTTELDAVYDFKDIPVELHSICLSLIQSNQKLRLWQRCKDHQIKESSPLEDLPVTKPKKSWLAKLLGVINVHKMSSM